MEVEEELDEEKEYKRRPEPAADYLFRTKNSTEQSASTNDTGSLRLSRWQQWRLVKQWSNGLKGARTIALGAHLGLKRTGIRT